MTTFLEIHVLQPVPPNNMNRDDNGSPKTAVFGGTLRAFVSSQAWKHAMRKDFAPEMRGIRSRVAIDLLARRVMELNLGLELEEAHRMALEFFVAVKVLSKAPTGTDLEVALRTGEGSTMQSFGAAQIDAAADVVIYANSEGNKYDVKTIKAGVLALKSNTTVDQNMFGRMFANLNDLNVNACVQVAPAISVHTIVTEFDFFVATPDIQAEGRSATASAMMGTTELTSGTLYRTTNLNVTQLIEQMGPGADVAATIRALIMTFVTSMPTGKQNSFGNRTVPDAVVITVREGQPLSLANAFEEPIVARDGLSRATLTARALSAEFTAVNQMLPASSAPQATWVVRLKESAASLDDIAGAARVTLAEAADAAIAFTISE